MAAALANVDDRDSWKVHFADTMRGGQYVNNWRMAELHAKEAPARVKELEAWGAVFDRTKDGKILQRNFGGHRYPRLAHVGDRTGPRDDPHPPGPRHPPGHRGPHGVHHRAPAQGRRPHRRRLRLRPRARACSSCSTPRRWCWPPAASAGPTRSPRTAGNTPATATPWPIDAGADLHGHGVRPVPSHRHGLAAQRAGILVTEGVRGEGGVLRTAKASASCSTTSRRTTGTRPPTTPRKAGATPRATRTPAARPSCSRATTSPAASCARSSEGRGSPHGGVFLDIAWIKEKLANAPEHIKKKLPSMYHQFKQLADIDITTDADGGRPDHALHHGRRTGRRRHPDVHRAGLFAAGECAAGHQRRQPPGRQLAVRPAGVRQAGWRVRRQVREGERPPAGAGCGAGGRGRALGAGPVRPGARAAQARTRSSTSCRT